jgi:ribosomal protein S18 acetylase RimI-like enzyme
MASKDMGVGEKLLQRGIEWAKEEGADDIELIVNEFNKNAQKLFKKLGFKTLHRSLSFVPVKAKSSAGK